MSNDILTSITIYGKINNEAYTWGKWLDTCKYILSTLGCKANYLSIESATLKSGKVMKLKMAEKKLLQAIVNQEKIKWVNVYSLPSDFKSAAFDYEVLLVRTTDYVSLIMSKNGYSNINEEEIIGLLKEHIDIENGEIYEVDREESPLIYASKANPASSFKTLKIIKDIR